MDRIEEARQIIFAQRRPGTGKNITKVVAKSK
jgi:hypothetical protein